MPGIHLRTFSNFNWFNQGRESILTVPGSYWLCHKKNIYKFIFKYHHTVKNIMQFSYGRELLKIIRRIIKCHPGQGQQFGTQHLLVTYNYTSWTRQDKMFALLKFQQRTNAATFSHAFVLTIRICPSKESLCNRRYPIVKEIDTGVTFQDLNVSLDTKEKITKSVTCTINKVSSKISPTISATKKLDKISNYNIVDNTHEILKATVNPNFQDNIVTTSIHFHESPDAKMKNATITSEVHLVDKRNTEFHNMCKAKFVNNNIKKNTKYSIDFMQGKSLEAYNKINEIEIKNVDEKIKSTVMKKQDQEPLNTRKYKMFSSKLPITEITEHDVNEWSLSNKFSFMKDSIKKSDAYVHNNENDLDGKITTEKYIGSIDMPYQYFIKKKIENTKHDILINQSVQINSEITKKNINENIIPKIIKPITNTSMQKDRETFDLKSKENDEQYSNIQILSNDDNQFQNNTYNKYKVCKQKNKEPEKKIITEDKLLRSSNITDLVMEGLMFTIKQDKDSVAVIEQKTKLEMDEVLENSEKVETKAGEKCLLNSSLMRLENLVTMLDSPQEQQNKTDYASGNSAHLLPLHIFPNCAVHNLSDTNYTNRRLNKSNVFSSNIRNDRMNDLMDLVQYQSRWQYVSSDISDNTNLLTIEDLMNKDKYLMKWQDSNEQNKKDNQVKVEVKEYEKEGEKDIISENLGSTIFSKKAMNDMENVKQIGKYESFVEKCSDPIEMHTTAALNERKLQNVSTKSKLNIPRIISNKLITVEQIPLALQKVLQHNYKTHRFSSATISSETLKHDRKIQHSMTKNVIPKTTILSLEDEDMNFNIANKSIKVAIDLEETKCDKNKCSIIDNESNLKINKNTLEINDQRYIYARNAKGSNSKIQRFSRRNSMLKHGSSRKLQDITEDFYYDLHAHNKDSTIQQRCLRQRHRSLDNTDNIKNDKVRIEMLKFIQDITKGARVVVKRLDMNNKSNLLKKISL